jgi:hypothetical protein
MECGVRLRMQEYASYSQYTKYLYTFSRFALRSLRAGQIIWYPIVMHYIIIIVIIIISGALYYRSTREMSEATVSNQREDGISEKSPAAETTLLYANGTYAKPGTYTSPGGSETIDVGITLIDGIVTDATFAGKATNPASIKNQEKFAAGFREQVVGKPLDQVNLTVVNGSSLTPQGFMEALGSIKEEARS